MKFAVTFDTLPDVAAEDMAAGLRLLLAEFFQDCPYLVTPEIKVEHEPEHRP